MITLHHVDGYIIQVDPKRIAGFTRDDGRNYTLVCLFDGNVEITPTTTVKVKDTPEEISKQVSQQRNSEETLSLIARYYKLAVVADPQQFLNSLIEAKGDDTTLVDRLCKKYEAQRHELFDKIVSGSDTRYEVGMQVRHVLGISPIADSSEVLNAIQLRNEATNLLISAMKVDKNLPTHAAKIRYAIEALKILIKVLRHD